MIQAQLPLGIAPSSKHPAWFLKSLQENPSFAKTANCCSHCARAIRRHKQRVRAEKACKEYRPLALQDRQLRLPIAIRRSIIQPFRRGHVNPGVLFKRWNEVRGVLEGVLHIHKTKARRGDKWKRVEMVMLGLKLQAVSGHCFAKASTMATAPFTPETKASERTWRRCVKLLEERGLANVARLIRADDTQAENYIDFTPLWLLVLQLLKAGASWEVVRAILWVKASAVWRPVGAVVRGAPQAWRPPLEGAKA